MKTLTPTPDLIKQDSEVSITPDLELLAKITGEVEEFSTSCCLWQCKVIFLEEEETRQVLGLCDSKTTVTKLDFLFWSWSNLAYSSTYIVATLPEVPSLEATWSCGNMSWLNHRTSPKEDQKTTFLWCIRRNPTQIRCWSVHIHNQPHNVKMRSTELSNSGGTFLTGSSSVWSGDWIWGKGSGDWFLHG